MRTPANVTTRSKEGPRFVDGRPEPFTLANPHQQTILQALETIPFNPRWMARFELESGELSDKGIKTTATVRCSYDGRLEFQGISRNRFGRLPNPDQEITAALGQRASDIIEFPDSLSSGNKGYQEFLNRWFPKLTEAGYQVTEALLVDQFTGYGDRIHPNTIISGASIDRNKIKIFGDPKPEFPFIMSTQQAKDWFDSLVAFNESLTARPQ